MTQVKAALVRTIGEPLTIEEITPSDVRPDEVRVATRAVGLCHSDLHLLDGRIVRPTPHLLGHEASGVVIEIGSDVDSVAVGDHVVACLVVSCGECRQCNMGHRSMCANRQVCNRAADDAPRFTTADGAAVTPFSNVGALAEEMILHHSAVTPIPAEVPFDVAALMGCAVVTGFGSVEKVARVQPGESVVVVGCGGVGLNIILAAVAAGAAPVIAVDLDPARRRLAVDRFGATHAIDGADIEALVNDVKTLTDGGADHAFDAVGAPFITRTCMSMTAPSCSAYAVGIYGEGAELQLDGWDVLAGRKLVGVRMGDVDPGVDIPALADRYLAGELPLDQMISDHITLDDTAAGFERLRNAEGARSVVVFPGAT